jgi:hypothetical protein
MLTTPSVFPVKAARRRVLESRFENRAMRGVGAARALCRRMSICSYNQFGDPTF